MRKMITKITIGLLPVGMWITPLAAQRVFEKQIPVKIQQLKQVDDSVQLLMELDLSMLTIGTERSLLLTPVLVGAKGEEMKMPHLLINGRQRQKVFLRGMELNKKQARRTKNEYYQVIGLNNNNRKIYRYSQTVAFEKWMREAHMNIVSGLCGCASFEPQIVSEKVADRIVLEGRRPYRAVPGVAYLHPEIEVVKARSESNNIFLDFEVAQIEINPFFGNNPRELAKIESILKELRSDANLQVTGVTITGFASPEGNVQVNNQISRNRAEALRNYLSTRSNIPPYLYRIGNGGEDWEELTRMVQIGRAHV